MSKQADLILMDHNGFNLSPVLVRDGVAITADEETVRAEAQGEMVARCVAGDSVHNSLHCAHLPKRI